MSDIRYAVRWLVKSPGFALVAILSLGIGIGVNTSIFAIVDTLLLRPLPVSEPARLVDIYTSGADGDRFSTNAVPDLDDFRTRAVVFEDVIGYTPMMAAVSSGDRARLVLGEIVTGNYFRMLGIHARAGRTLAPEDDVPGAPRVAVLSSRYWEREFGGQLDALGKTLRIRGQQFTIVGVLNDDYTGMFPMLAPEIWIATRYHDEIEPIGINENTPSPTGTSRLDRRGQRWMFSKARLKAGVSVDEAQANMSVLAAQLRTAHPQTNKDRHVVVRAASQTRAHPEADAYIAWIGGGTMAAVGLVLLIACANVAGMLLARASGRRREIAIRLALGAPRSRLIRQLMTESLVLGGLGAIVGVALAWWTTRALSTLPFPLPVPLVLDVPIDLRALSFTIVAAVLTGVLAGVMPALRASRAEVVGDLKGEVGAQRIRGRRWTARDGLVVAQVAVTVVLLVTAGLLLRSLQASTVADLGFQSDGIAILSTDPDMLRYSPERSQQFWDEAEQRLRALPGVEHVAFASRLPFSINFNRSSIAIPGQQTALDQPGITFNAALISKGYFRALGVGLIEGRDFDATDRPDTPRVAIVSESFARRYWPGQSALGKVVHERNLAGPAMQIIGVAADHKQQTVGEDTQPTIYSALSQRPTRFQVVFARTSGDDTQLLSRMRETLLALEPDLLFLDNQTMKGQVSGTLFPVRVAATLVTVFGALALLLAAIGLYGVIAFSVARRTREIGIRMAIGARPGGVMQLVLQQGLTLVGVGLIIGAILSAAATRVIAGALYGISAADPVAWGLAASLLLVIGTAANLIPARRAMRVNPITALRME
jgi:macrolide transport system ATP-binding/permease protein